ncbi:hypothetical protein HOLleu_17435 [Holothuria leucospilota]|uniref:Uncharacterized protein n=1 Tax=Holothuria leucospilota TaxID=206669 RepID=A0A9Q1C1C6_HOLLE|nr:hypothetical protein HOLleu_17435 [Holothuria leucospilota]
MAVAYTPQAVYNQFPQHQQPVACMYSQQEYNDESESESDFESDIDMESEEIDDYTEEDDVEPTVTDRLLDFAETVSRDIQKYFSKRKILEEKSEKYKNSESGTKQLSGREQYYADLMKVVEGENTVEPSRQPVEQSRIILYNGDNRDKPSGKTKDSTGLGGLEDLFVYAKQSNYSYMLTSDITIGMAGCKETKTNSHREMLPWKRRNLPSSFFMEPNSGKRQSLDYSSNETPDFSDLMANIADEDTVHIPQPTPMMCQACR